MIEMADFKVRKIEQAQARLKNVPIAVTPEGFWCCPSPVVLQKTLKIQNQQNKHRISSPVNSKSPSVQRASIPPVEKRTETTLIRSRIASEDQRCLNSDTPASNQTAANQRPHEMITENQQQKISVGFGQPGSSDLKILLYGKEGIAVKMSVHSNILAENSSFFANKLSRHSPVSCIEIADCEDVEIYVETVGLMYCTEMRYRLIKQTVPRVLRILKVSKSLGFHSCIISCLDYLEAVPWVGEEEEENVVSSIRHLQSENYGVILILKRVAADTTKPPNDTLSHVLELVLKSNEDRGRREMKSLVLKLLKENSLCNNGSADKCIETIYSSCQFCLNSLLTLFREASEPGFSSDSSESKDLLARKIALEADNLQWLVEILTNRHVAEEFAIMWAGENELAELHPKLPITLRHLVNCITAKIFVGIGRGEILPSKKTRKQLLDVWFKPLVDDYSWLQHGCRSFDQKVVEEGIGRTILTLPLEDQRSFLLSWLGIFLKLGGSCPNLHRAFEIWWRRTFIRPYVEQQQISLQSDMNSFHG